MGARLLFLAILLMWGCGSRYETTYEAPSSPKIVKIPEIVKVKTRGQFLKDVKYARDPFVSLEKQGLQVSEELEEITQPKLSAIIYGPGEKLAIIKGQILKTGDIVDSKEIVDIRPESIVLKESGKRYLLKLTDVVGFRNEKIEATSGNETISGNGDMKQENALSEQ